MRRRLPFAARAVAAAGLLLAATSMAGAHAAGSSDAPGRDVVPVAARGSLGAIIPRPSRMTPDAGDFLLSRRAAIEIVGARSARPAARLLRDDVAAAVGARLRIVEHASDSGPKISFALSRDRTLGREGYVLRIRPDHVTVLARERAGFGWAVQTVRQILPAAVDAARVHPGTWALLAVTIRDVPRFEWRGVMLDVARHFFTVAEVERVVDVAARYKLNRLHLHLSDDQGWRLQVRRYPELTEIGGRTALGGGPGGSYTQRQYRALVAYAARRGVVIVPEIDLPGHTQAALASLAWLNCDGRARTISTGPSPLTSSLCIRPRTSRFVDDVLGEVSRLSAGPYLHVGGDESNGTDPEAYDRFVTRTVRSVRALGKVPVVWDDAAAAHLGRDTVVQAWLNPEHALAAARQGARLVMSPAGRAYLDMKYDASTPIGQAWAGFIDTRTAYGWDPAAQVPGVPASQVIGLEAPLWTETVTTPAQVERMLLPRLPAYAEIGWSAPEGKDFDEFRTRVAAQAARWRAIGLRYTRDATIPW